MSYATLMTDEAALVSTRTLSARARVQALIDHPAFSQVLLGIILFNALLLGLEADPRVPAQWRGVLDGLDAAITLIFVVELALKMFACRVSFFRSGWNLFDLVVVGVSVLSQTSAVGALRVLRVLRVLRMFSLAAPLRRVVDALFRAVPGMGAILAVLVLLFYVSAVMATALFAPTSPELFGTLERSAFTLFQVMTLDGWSSDIVKEVMRGTWWAWMFFLPFIVLTSFMVLNLFIAVIVESLQEQHEAQMEQTVEAEMEEAGARAERDHAAVLLAIEGLRTEVRALRAGRGDPGAGPP